MMKLWSILLATAAAASAFTIGHDYGTGQSLTSLKMAYVPDGMSAAQWKKLQEKEKSAKSKKQFGAFGPQSFKSRSLQSFQTDLEKGQAGHLLPVFNAKEKVKSGKLRQEDIPYMQRGGSWDNSDVKSAKKRQWSALDKKYNANPTPSKLTGNTDLGFVQRGNKPTPKKSNVAPKPKKAFGFF